MSFFNEAYVIGEKHEGGYANDPDDRGGETYKGIARNFWSKWKGWKIIDIITDDIDSSKKNIREINIALSQHSELPILIKSFYKEQFFDIFNGDAMPKGLACEMFEHGINLGTKQVVKHLQETLNLLNRNEKFYPDISEDGAYGKNTETALKTFLNKGTEKRLLTVMNILQGHHYIELMKKKPVYEKYIGWFDRTNL